MRTMLWFIMIGVCGGLLFAAAPPQVGAQLQPFYNPSLGGPWSVAELNSSITDRARGRSIGLITLFPSSDGRTPSNEGAPHPLIVFSHGFLLKGELYRSYAQHLASHGFLVALPTYETGFTVNHVDLKDDLIYLLDHYLRITAQPDHALYGAVDPANIGVSGHSLGGKISLFAASQHPRIRASATLDPVDGGGPGTNDPVRFPSVTPELMQDVAIPLLFIGNDLGNQSKSGVPCAPEAENYQRFFEAAEAPAVEVTQLDVGHEQYLDNADSTFSFCPRGKVRSADVRAMARSYLTAFYLAHLQGNPQALPWLQQQLEADQSSGKITFRQK